MWHEPGVLVVVDIVVVFDEPPAGSGVVELLVTVVDVDGTTGGVGTAAGAGVTVVVTDVVDVVCATDSGAAIARLAANAQTAKRIFMSDLPWGAK